jgi:hypothetical protein
MDALPALSHAAERWRRRVLRFDAAMFAVLLIILGVVAYQLSGGDTAGVWQTIVDRPWLTGFGVVVLVVALAGIHFFNRRWLARRIARTLPTETASGNWRAAFEKNTRVWQPMFRRSPVGLGRRMVSRLHQLRDRAEAYIQRLNNEFVDVSPVSSAGGQQSASGLSQKQGTGAPGPEADADAGSTQDVGEVEPQQKQSS